MSKVLNWIVNLIPEEYRIGVGIKKAAYMVGKLGAGYVTSQLVTTGKLTPEQCSQVQVAITALTAGGLELLHDWAKLKWPNVPLL